MLGGAILIAAAVGNATGSANWGAEDFAFATLIFGVAGLGVGVATTLPTTRMVRAVAIGGVALLVALIWIEAAVGIFD